MQMPQMDGHPGKETHKQPNQVTLVMLTSMGRQEMGAGCRSNFAAFLNNQLNNSLYNVLSRALAISPSR